VCVCVCVCVCDYNSTSSDSNNNTDIIIIASNKFGPVVLSRFCSLIFVATIVLLVA